MPQVKEPYGLVYNTDGSLCATYRDDDIPFPGVRSFAVEEATENLFVAPFDYIASTYDLFLVDPTGRFEFVHRFRPHTGNSHLYKVIPTTAGNSYSMQAWCYVSQDFDGDFARISGEIGVSFTSYYDLSKKGTWQFLKAENVIATGTTGRFLLYGKNFTQGYILFARPQVEEKPFCTSYVDGSRPSGKIVFEDMQEIEYDNFVFTCWANYRSVAPSWQFVTTIFTPDNALASGANHYSIRRRITTYLNINSYDFGIASIGYTVLEEGWHFFLIAVHDGQTDFWIDDVKYTSSKYVVNSKDKNIYLGTWYDGSFHWQNTIANVFVGKYKKPNGTVIWTDDYIREVYEAQIPFPVSNKLSIY